MTHPKLFRSVAIAAGVAVIGLAGANAQAHVVAGNYQDHVLPNTTRHVGHSDHPQPRAHYAGNVAENSHVEAGNSQGRVLPRSTRHDASPVRESAHHGRAFCSIESGANAC